MSIAGNLSFLFFRFSTTHLLRNRNELIKIGMKSILSYPPFVIHAISQREYLFPVYHHNKDYKIMNNIDPTMEISANLQEYSKVIEDINNALDEFYEVLPDIKNTKGEERKENLDIWVKHINDLKDSCKQLIDEIEEKKREINF